MYSSPKGGDVLLTPCHMFPFFVRADVQKALADPAGPTVQPVVEAVQAKPQSKMPWVAAIVLAILVGAASVWLLRPAEPRLCWLGQRDTSVPVLVLAKFTNQGYL